jgi:curved DNA-binding protein CbpA
VKGVEPDHYGTVGVEPGATAEEIRAAYRRRSRELHPDRNAAPDANRQMAALNAAYAVLADPEARARYDIGRPKGTVRVRSGPATPPASGRGSLQPERFPDWYEFLGLKVEATSAEVLVAARVLGAQLRAAGYAPEVEDRLLAQLRTAADWLTSPALRPIYDAAWAGRPPPAGQHAHLHTDFYSFLGVGPGATLERIANRVTALSGSMRAGSAEQRELAAAWKTLRDPARRAAYDRELEREAAAARP